MQLNALNRRHLLAAMTGSACAWAAPWAMAQGSAATPGRLVVVFLRGAYDGLSALVPHGDADYYRIRPSIAIPAPDGSANTTLQLDQQFGLHPALAPLLPLWQQGVLAAIPCAGSPDGTRSHFDAQHHWETGIPGNSSATPGWLNTLSGQTRAKAIGVGEANPRILAGTQSVQLVPKGDAATRKGALGDARTRDAVMRLYAGDDALSQTFRAGAESRTQTADMLKESNDMTAGRDMDAVMQAANNGAGNVKGLAQEAQHLGTLMRANPQLRLGFLSAGGWDTHANQGAATGALATNLAALAQALVLLRREFNRRDDVVLVVSEFGRTSAENGTRGSDHGHGNALWLLGNRVQGGRWHGQWSGLASGNLHEGRDLPVHHDFRAVFAQVLRGTQGVTSAQLDALFPGFAWDARLDGVVHRA
ncbi:MAG: DUF1501 domain-containing protein [Rhodoferax sp.]|nr:MAG: DUF1501 domain-containing protein [Rhodoferax sp.]